MKRVIVAAAIAVIALLSLAVILASRAPQEPANIMTATIQSGISGLDALDASKEIQKAAGINVTVIRLQSSPLVVDALLKGEAQIAVIPVELAAVAMEKGGDVYIIAVDYELNQAILTRNDSNILTPMDLKGRKVAAVVGTGTYALFTAFMKNLYNLTVGPGEEYDVQVVNLAPAATIDAVARGDVDAAVIWEPLVSAGIEKGLRVVATYKDLWRSYAGDKPAPMLVWVASRELASNKTLLEKVLEAHRMTAEKWNGDKNWTLNFLVETYKLDRGVAESVWERDPMYTGRCIDDAMLDSITKIWGLARDAGYIKSIPSTDRIITCSRLASIGSPGS